MKKLYLCVLSLKIFILFGFFSTHILHVHGVVNIYIVVIVICVFVIIIPVVIIIIIIVIHIIVVSIIACWTSARRAFLGIIVTIVPAIVAVASLGLG